MRCDVLTLFPEMVTPVLDASIIKRAREKGLLDVRVINIRDFTFNKHRTADDYPYGGGAGMVLKVEPIIRAIDFIREKDADLRIILLSPQGKQYKQETAVELSTEQKKLVFLCGHYEGIDERVKTYLSPEELSIGDYVLTGGELAALVVIDSIVRLIPGVLGDSTSVQDESFNDILDYPHYTRPAEYMDMHVPSVLLSGDHGKIKSWRRKQALLNTLNKRPDLLKYKSLTVEEREILEDIKLEKSEARSKK
ncbi:MAG: tRNA (guanosine(37)-N1)-methyltransferase TrmD [Nitrospirae bacterium]|nr:tRNA (guanosine(37)-N1)-methyltransferase TrmD [Nitrospirota bacterium]